MGENAEGVHSVASQISDASEQGQLARLVDKVAKRAHERGMHAIGTEDFAVRSFSVSVCRLEVVEPAHRSPKRTSGPLSVITLVFRHIE